jgi:hypothetical protein
MNNNEPKDSFLEGLKKSLENYDLPETPSDWDVFEKKLDAQTPSGGISSAAKFISAAVLVVAIASGYYFWNESNIEQNTPQPNKTTKVSSDDLNTDITTTDNQHGNSIDATENALSDQTNQNSASQETIALTTTNKEATAHTPNKSEGNTAEKHKSSTKKKESQQENPQILQIPSFSFNKTELCSGEALTGKIDNPGSFNEFSWLIRKDDRLEINGAGFSEKLRQPGTYEVTLYAASDEFNPYEETTVVHVYAQPEAEFETTLEYSENRGVIRTSNYTSNADSYSWFVNGEQKSKEKNPMFELPSGNYELKLISQTAEMCKHEASQRIKIDIEHNFLLAPNAFTPDGDGINDDFIPRRLEVLDNSFNMLIFNPKTGRVIF